MTHRSLALSAAFPFAALLAAPLAAQATGAAIGTIPAFMIDSSPLALTGDARRGVFISAVGRRAIAMGSEDGKLELWSWPVKWLHDFELSFRVPKPTRSRAPASRAR